MGKKISWEDAQKLGSNPNKNESIYNLSRLSNELKFWNIILT